MVVGGTVKIVVEAVVGPTGAMVAGETIGPGVNGATVGATAVLSPTRGALLSELPLLPPKPLMLEGGATAADFCFLCLDVAARDYDWWFRRDGCGSQRNAATTVVNDVPRRTLPLWSVPFRSTVARSSSTMLTAIIITRVVLAILRPRRRISELRYLLKSPDFVSFLGGQSAQRRVVWLMDKIQQYVRSETATLLIRIHPREYLVASGLNGTQQTKARRP
jgi:hypothetical protein